MTAHPYIDRLRDQAANSNPAGEMAVHVGDVVNTIILVDDLWAELGRLIARLGEADRDLVCCDECYALGKRFDGITADPVPMTDEEFDEFMDTMGRSKR